MSWIKKIFTIFQNDEENKIDERISEQRVSKPLHPERKQSKELEAKVVYQYPKGQFRFPLIPDGQNIESEDRPKKRQPKKSEPLSQVKPLYNEKRSLKVKGNNDQVKRAAPKYQPEREKERISHFRPEQATEPVSKYRPELRKEGGPKFRQPFKPTEIPSPIHAFNRPPLKPVEVNKAEEVEFELSGFDREQETPYQHLTEKYELPIVQDLPDEAEREPELAEISDGIYHENQQKENVDASSAEMETIQGTTHSEPGSELPEVLSEDGEEAISVPNQAIIEVMNDQPNQDLYEEKDGLMVDAEESESYPESRGADVAAKAAGCEAEVKGDHELGHAEDNAGKRGRQLPFNVIMLKQDKRKWDERNHSAKHSRPEGMKTAESKVPTAMDAAETASFGTEAVTSITKEPPYAGPGNKDRQSASTGLVLDENPVEYEEPIQGEYEFPPLSLLSPPVFKEADPTWLAEQEQMLNETLRNFNVGARVVNMTQGPSVTRFEVQPEPGVKVNKITNLSDDIKLSLAAKDIRIEAPIPGKHTIGIEVPNQSSRPVLLSEILQAEEFLDHDSPLSVALGLDIAGNPIVTDLKKMPHGLIAGATGSGKSVCINTMLVSLLYKANPDDVKLLLIDPKMVELAPYNQIPHLVSPVITDVKAATAALKWAVDEMERRYELFAHTGVRDINRFNELAVKHRRFSDKLPFIVIVIDELADLMMMAPADVEEAICRIAQKARACGIHLIIATQRPSVDVITGLIKANVPTRIAFSVSSQVDSRTIIDISGAEKLLGRGDMLFLENGSSKPFRLQGTFVTDNEIDDIVAFVREQRAPEYLFEQEELLRKAQITEEEDELFFEACEFVVDQGGASTSSVQRRFKIGYNRAARLIEMMEQQGFISEGKGSKPRDVLISAADLESLHESSLN